MTDIPGTKSGLIVLIHSSWLFLNPYLLFEWLISSGGNVYIRTVFPSNKIKILDHYQSYLSSLLNQLRRWQSVPFNQLHDTWKGCQRWYIRLLICVYFIVELFQTWNSVVEIVLKDCTLYKMTCIIRKKHEVKSHSMRNILI